MNQPTLTLEAVLQTVEMVANKSSVRPDKNYPQHRPMPHPGAPKPSDVDNICPHCKGTGVDDPEFDGWDDEGWKRCEGCKGVGMLDERQPNRE